MALARMYWVRADWGESEPLILISVRNNSASNQIDGISVNMGRSRFRAFAGWPIFLLFIGFLLWVFFKAPQILILDSISWNWIRARGLRVYLWIFFKKNLVMVWSWKASLEFKRTRILLKLGFFKDKFNAEPQVPSSKQNEARGLPNWAHLFSAHQWKFFKDVLEHFIPFA